MKRLVLPLLIIFLCACGTSPQSSSSVSKQAVELLIAPGLNVKPFVPTATPWLSPMSATAKAQIEARQNRSSAPASYEPTPTLPYHEPKNIYSPTPGPRSSASGSGCTIKGNVSLRNNNEKIYHCPNWRDYDKVDIIEREGDRMFCTEDEAIAAGFRRPQNVKDPCLP